MNELIGMWFIFSAIIFGCICLFGADLTLKEKIETIGVFEIFVVLLMIGAQLLSK